AWKEQVLTGTSDEEIYHTVMDSMKARENMEMTGGGDVHDSNLVPLVVRFSR
ncbi:hypothetical protein K443DRAFT_96360, partial [Laccaria amethystina LaAM-08-1]